VPLTLLLGGARSGKSALAQRMGEAWDGPVVVVVTARSDEAGMAERIRRHRAERPAGPPRPSRPRPSVSRSWRAPARRARLRSATRWAWACIR